MSTKIIAKSFIILIYSCKFNKFYIINKFHIMEILYPYGFELSLKMLLEQAGESKITVE